MNDTRFNPRLALSAFILVHVACVLAAYGGLVIFFDFPDILREPADVFLSRFRARQTLVVTCYAVFMWSQVAFSVVAVLMRERFAEASTPWLRAATPLGVVAGFAQAVGFSRWAFVVPSLAASYPTDSGATLITLDTLHRFAGVAVGEHLFFLFEALWVAGLALHFLDRPDHGHVSRRGATLLLLIAGLIALYGLEQFGGLFAILGPVNVTAHGGLIFWLLGFALCQIADRPLRRPEIVVLVTAWAALVAPSWL